MSKEVLIGIDAGTSVMKAVAFDKLGNQIAATSCPNHYRILDNGGVEQDIQSTWLDATKVLKQLVEQVDNLASRTIALSVTGQGDGTWLIDADGNPVHDAWLWLDSRAAEEVDQIANSDEIDVIYHHTGTGINVCQMRTHLRWMQRNSPELLERAATAFHCKDWLYFQLTGFRASDPSESVFTFGNFRSRTYSDNVIHALGLKELRHLLPPIIDGSIDSHPLTVEAASATGLPQGLPVVLGYVDAACSALGAGIYDLKTLPGLTILGSTGIHTKLAIDSDSIKLNTDRTGYIMTLPGEAYLQMQLNMVATINLDWWLDIGLELLASQGVKRTRHDILNRIDESVLATKPGRAIYHPYISKAGERGPFMEPKARASLTGLDQNVGWIDIVRSIYDGIALASKDCYMSMGSVPKEIRLTGGAARSNAMKTIFSNALGVPVRGVDQPEAGAAGAAMIAAVQQGIYPDIASCSEMWLNNRLLTPLQPDKSMIPIYDSLYTSYLKTRQHLPEIWNNQHKINLELQMNQNFHN